MKYLDFPSSDACVNLAMEYFLAEFDPFPGEDFCWFWNTFPTVVIGKYQVAQAEVDLAYLQEHDIRLVRRHSGGGTIYSDQNNLMFSIVTRGEEEGIDFRKFTAPLVELFRSWGLPVTHSGRNDLFLFGRKFSGNAQFHHKDCTVHHGTLLVDTDFDVMEKAITPPPDKITSKGISSVREHVINLKPYLPAHVLEHGLSASMREALTDGVITLSPEQQAQVLAIADEKFRGWDVLHGKSPKFSVTRSRKFAGGTLGVDLEIEHGAIRAANIHGDFFGDPEPMLAALRGAVYTREDLTAALTDVPLPHQIGCAELVEMLTDVSGR